MLRGVDPHLVDPSSQGLYFILLLDHIALLTPNASIFNSAF